MARQPLPVGTHGSVSIRAFIDGKWYPKAEIPDGVKPAKWEATTRYCDTDGSVNPVKRTGASETKAKTALEQACKERVGPGKTKLPPSSRFKTVAALWIDRVRVTEKGTTYDTHRRWLDGVVLPALGELRIRQCTPVRLQSFFDELAADPRDSTGKPYSANSRRGIRQVVSGVLQYAVVRGGILAANPVRQLERIKGGARSKPRAYDRKQASDFFTKIDADKIAQRYQLNQLLRFMFFTGARLGEALAVRWQELNLTDQPVKVIDPVAGEMVVPPYSVWISGNIVRVTGKGLLRHEGKTFSSQGIVGLPQAMVMTLLVMRPTGAGEREPVFPTGTGNWRCPNNLQASIRRLCARVEVDDFTSHIGRKTYGTALDSAGQTARQVSDGLRKASVTDTQNTYMGRGMANPAAAAAIGDFFTPAD